jgi:hypothetical protein
LGATHEAIFDQTGGSASRPASLLLFAFLSFQPPLLNLEIVERATEQRTEKEKKYYQITKLKEREREGESRAKAG